MKLDYLKEKKELVSVVLFVVSAFFAFLILVKVWGFFAAPAKAESLVKKAVVQNNTDANDMDKYFAEYKVLAGVLKKSNLFVPPVEKQHPVKEVWGILGNEVLIGKDKWYKVGDKVGDAKIVAIGPTQVTIEWDGKEKTFAPLDAAGSSQPGGPRAPRAVAKGGGPGGQAEMVTVGSQQRPMARPGGPGGPGGFRGSGGGFSGMAGMRDRFQNMSGGERDRFMAEMRDRRERYMNMSEAERERFRAEMRERFGGGRPGGGGSGRSRGGR